MAEPKRGGFVHIEFASTDPARTRRFLEDVFGWEFQGIPGLDYHVYATPLGPGGAVMPPSANRPIGVLNYLLCEDLDADVRKIEAAGGKVRIAREEIPNVGWWALFEDPTGILLALYQPQSPTSGPIARYRSEAPRERGATRRSAKGRRKRGARKRARSPRSRSRRERR